MPECGGIKNDSDFSGSCPGATVYNDCYFYDLALWRARGETYRTTDARSGVHQVVRKKTSTESHSWNDRHTTADTTTTPTPIQAR
jgi:hypothetical protein